MHQALPPLSSERGENAILPGSMPSDNFAAIWRLPQEILEMVFELAFASMPFAYHLQPYIDMLCVFLGHNQLPYKDERILSATIDWRADPVLYLAASQYDLQISRQWCRAAAQAYFRYCQVHIFLANLEPHALDPIPPAAGKIVRRVFLDMDYCADWDDERLHEMMRYLFRTFPAIESLSLHSFDMHCRGAIRDSYVVDVFPRWKWLEELVSQKNLQHISVHEASNEHGQSDAFFQCNSDIMDELDAYFQIRLATRTCGMDDYKVVAQKFGLLVKILCRKPKWKSRKHVNTDMQTCSQFTMKQWDIMEALGDMYEDIGNGEATNYFRALHSHSTMYWTWKRREDRIANALRAERVRRRNGVIEPEIGRVMTSLEGKINENANRGL